MTATRRRSSGSELRLLERRCRERLQGYGAPRPFNLELFCEAVASQRNRPILLLPMALSAPGPCGLWIAGRRQDYIVFEQWTSRLHQEHIVLHEIGHILFEHQHEGLSSDEHVRLVFPNLDPSIVRAALARTSYSSAEEREAEMIASLILQETDRQPIARHGLSEREAAAVARLETGLDPGGATPP